MLAQRGLGRALQQAMPALGHHHRIDDQRHATRELLRRGNDGADHFGAVQHAGLDRVGADVGQHHLDLLGDEGGIDGYHSMHAHRVLRGERGNRGGGKTTHRRHCLDVGLDAGATARIGTGDDQDAAFHAALFTQPGGESPR